MPVLDNYIGGRLTPQVTITLKNPKLDTKVLEARDEYKAENVFWVPKEAHWTYLQANAKQPTIGKLIDDAMVTIKRDNPSLKGILSKD